MAFFLSWPKQVQETFSMKQSIRGHKFTGLGGGHLKNLFSFNKNSNQNSNQMNIWVEQLNFRKNNHACLVCLGHCEEKLPLAISEAKERRSVIKCLIMKMYQFVDYSIAIFSCSIVENLRFVGRTCWKVICNFSSFVQNAELFLISLWH